MNKQIILYQPKEYSYPHIIKKVIMVTGKDEVTIDTKSGYTRVILIDSYQNGHNGDWEDEHESGYQTFKQAKSNLIKILKISHAKIIKQARNLKEINE